MKLDAKRKSAKRAKLISLPFRSVQQTHHSTVTPSWCTWYKSVGATDVWRERKSLPDQFITPALDSVAGFTAVWTQLSQCQGRGRGEGGGGKEAVGRQDYCPVKATGNAAPPLPPPPGKLSHVMLTVQTKINTDRWFRDCLRILLYLQQHKNYNLQYNASSTDHVGGGGGGGGGDGGGHIWFDFMLLLNLKELMYNGNRPEGF